MRGRSIDSAHSLEDTVVDQETKDYAIVVVLVGDQLIPIYGVRNKTTLVDEALSPALGKARWIMGELQKDLDAGFDRDDSPVNATPSAAEFFKGLN